MAQAYKTIGHTASNLNVIKKSRFIACVSPAADEQEALAFIHHTKEMYPDASHHCYAYILGQSGGVSRYSDAGEPGGTAGMPILETIKAKGIVNCCVVVTRYFGGVLLGTGGLSRAYSHSASLALDAAGIVAMLPGVRYNLEIAYPFWDKACYILQQNLALITGTLFTDTVRAVIWVRQSSHQALISHLRLLTGDKMRLEMLEEAYAPWPEE
jgi:uncharacterized YigZ family protein